MQLNNYLKRLVDLQKHDEIMFQIDQVEEMINKY